MAIAQSGKTVKVHYTGKLKDGTVFDSTEGKDPLEFKLGDQMVIKGFEDGVTGMENGEKKTIEIPVDKAYGPRNDELFIKIEKSKIPPDVPTNVGEILELKRPDGMQFPTRIIEEHTEHIVIDANHPLAGEDLTFELELVEIN